MYGLLHDMRVLEAASFIAAPSRALYLLRMAAEVIRIDQVGGGPDFNRWPPTAVADRSLYCEGLNKARSRSPRPVPAGQRRG